MQNPNGCIKAIWLDRLQLRVGKSPQILCQLFLGLRKTHPQGATMFLRIKASLPDQGAHQFRIIGQSPKTGVDIAQENGLQPRTLRGGGIRLQRQIGNAGKNPQLAKYGQE
ncbi:hypothetical protein [Synechococcus sp. R3-13]|uniref:hypothetical protein n=1 Tax=Synechococcus sp. R3-13 TaxID=2421316 RepID=UPI0039C089CB